MAKKKEKKDIVGVIVATTTYRVLKGEIKEMKVKRERLKDGRYKVTTFLGNKTIVKYRTYIKSEKILDVSTGKKNYEAEKYNTIIRKANSAFKKSNANDFTTSIQFFKGRIVDRYRGKIKGQVTRSAKMFSLKKKQKKNEIENSINQVEQEINSIVEVFGLTGTYTKTHTKPEKKGYKIVREGGVFKAVKIQPKKSKKRKKNGRK